jgi:flagellar biosynthesis protein FliQ
MTTTAAVEIADSVQEALNGFFDFIPSLIAALAILVVGWIVAKVIARIVRALLSKAGADRVLDVKEIREQVQKFAPGASIPKIAGKVVYAVIMLFVLIAALGALQIPAVTQFLETALAYIPNVIAAMVILVLAVGLSGVIGGAAMRVMGDTATGRVVATAVPAFVMVIAVFMVLEQLQVASEIVRIAFAAASFSLALGLALAFGLGGRSVAQRMLEDAYAKGQEQREHVRRDIELARERRRAADGREGGRFVRQPQQAEEPQPTGRGPAPADQPSRLEPL